MARLVDTFHPVIELENLNDIPHHNVDDDCEKIGEIYRLSPEHFSFRCSQCDEHFPLLIQFTAHVQTHLQDIFSCYIQPMTSPIQKCDTNDIEELNPSDDTQLENLFVESLNVESAPWDEHASTSDKETNPTIHNVPHRFGRQPKPPGSAMGRTFECYSCRIPCVNKKQCLEHIHTVHSNLNYHCKYCGKKFAKIHGRNIHARFCNQSNAFKCVDCHLTFHTEDWLFIHRKNTHQENLYRCKLCKETFTDEQSKVQHSIMHERQFQCDKCGQQFLRNFQLEQHKLIHSAVGSFKCNKCPKTFKQYSTWWTHNRIHTGKRNHKCEDCGKAFFMKTTLKRHEKSVHLRSFESRVECPVCHKMIVNAQYLQKHMRWHTGDNLLDCSHCELRFLYQHDLDRHSRAHSSQRDFQCDLCPKSFKHDKNLTAHRRIHLNDYKFLCQWCGKGFYDNRIYKRHTLTVHGRAWNEITHSQQRENVRLPE